MLLLLLLFCFDYQHLIKLEFHFTMLQVPDMILKVRGQPFKGNGFVKLGYIVGIGRSPGS